MKTVHDIIVKPIITEDSMARTADKKYTFEVMSGATKPEIAKAVEELFKVDVLCVNTVSMKKKPKRLGYHQGYTSEKGYRHSEAGFQADRVLRRHDVIEEE